MEAAMTNRVQGMAALAFAAAIGMGLSQSQASAILSNPNDTHGARTSADLSVGYQFTVGSNNLTVTALGYFDDSGDGLQQSHDVGLYSSTGATLGTVTVASGTTDPVVDDFRYADLGAPITLFANTTYYIAGETGTAVDIWADSSLGATITKSSDANTYIEYYDISSTLDFPSTINNGGHDSVYFGPNFEYTVVPEPACLGLLGVGAMSMLLRRQKASVNAA
jgi:hypothetical protein